MAVGNETSEDGRDGASGDDEQRPGGAHEPVTSGATRRDATGRNQPDQVDGEDQSDLVEGWIKRLRSRKLTAIPILIAVVIAAAAGIVDQLTGKSPLDVYREITASEPSYEPPSGDEWHGVESRPAPALAYRTADSIYVAPGGRAPELLFTFSPDTTGYNSDQLFWSSGGRYLGALLETDAGEIAWYFDTVTREQGSWRCECSGAAFVGSLLVGVESTQTNLKRFALDAKPTSTELDWPSEETPSLSYVLSAAEGGLLVGAPTHPGGSSAYGGPSTVYLLDLRGRASRLYDLPGNTAVRTAAIDPTGRSLAVVATSHLNACYESQEIVVVNAANGSERPISLPTDEAWAVHSVTWDADGDLWAAMVAFGPRLRDEDQPSRNEEHPGSNYGCSAEAVGRIHELRGASWTLVDTPPISATELSAGPNGDVAIIGPKRSPERVDESWGDLSVLTTDDGRVHALDDGVIEALWPHPQG